MGEPATSAKICLETNKGNLLFELWAKECPNSSKFFLDKCANGNLKDQFLFDKVVRNSIIRLNNPNIDKQMNDPIKTELNQRLRFNKRGLLCYGDPIDNEKKNGSFFITLKPFPEYNNEYTIFGKIIDNSIFNAVKISESELLDDSENTPIYPTKILKTDIIVPYFDDLILNEDRNEEPVLKKPKKNTVKEKKKKRMVVKLSFDDEEDENEDFKPIKIKSAHTTMKDKSLSTRKVVNERSPEIEANEEVTKEKLTARKIPNQKIETSQIKDFYQTGVNTAMTSSELDDKIIKLKSSLNSKGPGSSGNKSKSLLAIQREQFLNNQKFSKDKQLRELQTISNLEKFEEKMSDLTSNENKPIEEEVIEDSDEDTLDFMNHKLEFSDNENNIDDGLKTIGV